jgi:hypothetical protein
MIRRTFSSIGALSELLADSQINNGGAEKQQGRHHENQVRHNSSVKSSATTRKYNLPTLIK